MSLTARSGLAEVAACVARALARSKIRAVLTGEETTPIGRQMELAKVYRDLV